MPPRAALNILREPIWAAAGVWRKIELGPRLCAPAGRGPLPASAKGFRRGAARRDNDRYRARATNGAPARAHMQRPHYNTTRAAHERAVTNSNEANNTPRAPADRSSAPARARIDRCARTNMRNTASAAHDDDGGEAGRAVSVLQ